jgi:peptide/nickel transport system ATP-binding protein
LVAVVLPWAAFSYLDCDLRQAACQARPLYAHGAGSLFGIAGGLSVFDGASPAVGAAAWAVIALLVVGGAMAARTRAGGALQLAAVALYWLAVQGPLAQAGTLERPPVEFGLAVGGWVALLCAVASLAPLALRVRGPQAAAPKEGPSLEGARPADAKVAVAPAPAGAAAAVPAGTAAAAARPLLQVRNLTVRFYTYDGVLKALDGIDFDIGEREIVGLVGETGCGKSVTAKAILRLIPDPPGRITHGTVLFDGINLLDSIEDEARIKVNKKGRARIRRNRRIAERVEAVMRIVRGNDISMIFQEPTAALNPVVTVGEQVAESFLTHQVADMVTAIEARGGLKPLERRFHDLLRRREARAAEIRETFGRISVRNEQVKAAEALGDAATAEALRREVDADDRAIRRLTGVYRPRLQAPVVAGALALGGRLTYGVYKSAVSLDTRIALYRRIPHIGPRWLMGPVLEEAKRRVVEMLKNVNIPDPESKAESYPFELSGGMQQRVMIAMALACRPRLLLADEPTTALDVTIQAQVLSLIRGLRDQFGSSVILITHDLGVVAETCERVGVMYAGVMAEMGAASDIFNRPRHPYTVGLMRSIPETFARTGKLSIIPGSVPSLLTPPEGCRFHPRCPFAAPVCSAEVPKLAPLGPGHTVACHLYDRPQDFPKEAVAARDAGLATAWEEAVAT